MAAVSFSIVGIGVVASLRPIGWRLRAWAASVFPSLLGLVSLVYPDVDSSLSPAWELITIAWGIAFIAVAERAREPQNPLAAPPELAGPGARP